MALVDSVKDWAQVALNAGALLAGGVVWKMYFENLKATIGTKDAEVSLANKQAGYWREKAEELESAAPRRSSASWPSGSPSANRRSRGCRATGSTAPRSWDGSRRKCAC
ncbi:hypothetical protein ABN028_35015 [Actinopolymorpha sp. B17G11]|uniref:hypothetical protein n=1 Tax=Actinopolymorpha sp. B17G11 TaxID=3160861 RepID=UPI0032E3B94D